MNTLRQIEAFTGVTGNAGQHRHLGPRQASLRTVADLVPLLTGSQRSSMRAMIAGLERLPAIDLTAEIAETSGQGAFNPSIRAHPSGGAVLETVVNYFRGGELLPLNSDTHGLFNGIEIGPTGLAPPITFDVPGAYAGVVSRTGITSSGVTTLERRLGFTITAKPVKPPDPPAVVPPVIAVVSKGDGSFVVSGTGFVARATVHILVGDGNIGNQLAFTDTSQADGALTGFPTGKICRGQGPLFFTANDARLQPSNHRLVESNTVQVSCPF